MKQLKFVLKDTAQGERLVADDNGYLCFLWPDAVGVTLRWQWAIESGGGWTDRGPDDAIVKHAEGSASSGAEAESAMLDWLAASTENEPRN